MVLDMLSDSRYYTYGEIAQALTDAGYEIAKSSIARYAREAQKEQEHLRRASEQTQRLIQAVKTDHDIEATEVCSALLLDGFTRRLATAEEDFEDMPLDKVGRLVVQLQRSGVYKNRWKQDRKKTIDSLQTALLDKLRDEVQGDDELLAKLSGMVRQAAREEADKDDQ